MFLSGLSQGSTKLVAYMVDPAAFAEEERLLTSVLRKSYCYASCWMAWAQPTEMFLVIHAALMIQRALNSVTLTSVPNLGNIIYTHTYTPLIKSSVLIMIKGASLNTAFQTSAAYFIRICNLIFCQTEQTQLGYSVPWTQPTSDNLMSFAYSHCLACPHLLLKLVYCFNS